MNEFKSDGCSWWPDGNYGDCCYEHDVHYWFGGTWKQRLHADVELYRCIKRKPMVWVWKIPIPPAVMATIVFTGVRIFGSAIWPFHFRWGFGMKD